MANEKRLIDANDAQERLCAVCKNAFPGPCHPDYCNFVDAIRDSKTVDAVEVVRCKDCIHRVIGTWAKCTGRKPDDFCSDGVGRYHD